MRVLSLTSNFSQCPLRASKLRIPWGIPPQPTTIKEMCHKKRNVYKTVGTTPRTAMVSYDSFNNEFWIHGHFIFVELEQRKAI